MQLPSESELHADSLLNLAPEAAFSPSWLQMPDVAADARAAIQCHLKTDGLGDIFY